MFHVAFVKFLWTYAHSSLLLPDDGTDSLGIESIIYNNNNINNALFGPFYIGKMYSRNPKKESCYRSGKFLFFPYKNLYYNKKLLTAATDLNLKISFQ